MFSRNSYFKTAVKITISPGQALLILIDKYNSDSQLLSELKSLYLVGAEDDESMARIKQLLNDKALANYTISFEPHVISEDPTRRFFESYLSYYTLYSSIQTISKDELEYTLEQICTLLRYEEHRMMGFYFIERNPASKTSMITEYQDALAKIQSHECYEVFSDENKEKMSLLSMISFFALYPARRSNRPLPLDLYGKEYYSEDNRSRITKSKREQKEVRSCGLGLMKSHMPLAKSNLLFDEKISNYTRIADRNTFDPHSKWAVDNFSKLVHPFSASISGTMLGFIRVLAYFYTMDQLAFNNAEQLKTLFKCYISLLLFNSGGHSLHEFVAPINIDEVRDYFAEIDGFSDINLKSLFLDGNKVEFDIATNKTIEYNNHILNKKFVNNDVSYLLSVDSEFLTSKLGIIGQLNKIKEKFYQTVPRLLFLPGTANSCIKLISSSIADISKNKCNSESSIEAIIEELPLKLKEQTDSDIKEYFGIIGITALSSHKVLSKEYHYLNNIINEFKVQTGCAPVTEMTHS